MPRTTATAASSSTTIMPRQNCVARSANLSSSSSLVNNNAAHRLANHVMMRLYEDSSSSSSSSSSEKTAPPPTKELLQTIIYQQLTPFQIRVYVIVCSIPRGKVTTYKDIARHHIMMHHGKKMSCHAIGQALKRNPLAPMIPCHRVIASNMSLGGFFGQRGGAQLQRKRQLLLDEGVIFIEEETSDRGVFMIDAHCLFALEADVTNVMK